jgi:CRP/FNR family transcriptional regulator
MMDMISIISKLPLFHGLTPQQCAKLASIAVRKLYAKGESFFKEGDDAQGFFLILSGKVKVFKLSLEGKEQIFHILTTPEPFGEAAVFAGQHYPANAEALVQTQVLFFSRHSFLNLIRQEPSIALSMLALLSLRLRKLTTLVENLSLKEVPGRLAAYLLLLNDRNDSNTIVELDVSRNQLASLLGTIPETLSRILKRMADEKLIKADARTISILDKQGLTDLAEGNRKLN